MAIPTGARKVSYTMGLSGSGVPEVDVEFTATIIGDTLAKREASDAAVQVGANAIVSYLETSYPGVTVVAARYYETYNVDSGWPVP